MPGEVPSADGVLGIPDLGLAGEEHEHVAAALAVELVERVVDAVDRVGIGRWAGRSVAGVVQFVIVHRLGDERPVADLDRVGAPGHLDDRRGRAVGIREVPREALRVDRRRGDDDLEVGAPRQQLLEVAEQEVDGEAALVRLVDDDRVVLAQHAVAVDLVEQDAVGHQLDAGVLAHPVGEAHLVADELADLLAELLGDALGDRAGGDAARLGVPDARRAELEQIFGSCVVLPEPVAPADDHDLVVADGARSRPVAG